VQRCFGWLALTVLLVSGGHRQLIEVLLDSFVAVPLGSPPPQVAAAPLAGQLLAHCFQSGLRVAAPVAFCLIAATALVAVLARTMPALGAFGVSVALNLLILLLVTSVSLEAMATVYQDAWSSGVDRLLVGVLRPEGTGTGTGTDNGHE
jgi:flagellar biosynthetic protein FliR